MLEDTRTTDLRLWLLVPICEDTWLTPVYLSLEQKGLILGEHTELRFYQCRQVLLLPFKIVLFILTPVSDKCSVAGN